MAMKILILNGPPGCGKDTAMKALEEAGYRFAHLKFASRLRAAVCGLLSIRDEELDDLKRRDPRVRKAMIALSENVVKELWGNTFFAEAAATDLMNNPASLAVISDGGFAYEVGAFLASVFAWRQNEPVEAELWQIHRPGCDFKNDSREWVWNGPDDSYRVRSRKVFNTMDDVDQFKENVLANIEPFWGAP